MAVITTTAIAIIAVLRRKIKKILRRFRRSKFEPHLLASSSKGEGKTSRTTLGLVPSYVALHPSDLARMTGCPRRAYFESQKEKTAVEGIREGFGDDLIDYREEEDCDYD